MARVNWAALLNLQGLAGRWRSAMGEGATAVEDRMELARLEWADHKRRLALLALLLVVFGVLAVVALLLLSAAVLVQFWDTSQRALAACAGHDRVALHLSVAPEPDTAPLVAA